MKWFWSRTMTLACKLTGTGWSGVVFVSNLEVLTNLWGHKESNLQHTYSNIHPVQRLPFGPRHDVWIAHPYCPHFPWIMLKNERHSESWLMRSCHSSRTTIFIMMRSPTFHPRFMQYRTPVQYMEYGSPPLVIHILSESQSSWKKWEVT